MSEDVGGGGGGIDMGKLQKGTILALCVEVRACTLITTKAPVCGSYICMCKCCKFPSNQSFVGKLLTICGSHLHFADVKCLGNKVCTRHA